MKYAQILVTLLAVGAGYAHPVSDETPSISVRDGTLFGRASAKDVECGSM